MSRRLVMIKAVLFDFGGVIYQHPKAIIAEVLAKIYHQPLEVAAETYNKYKNDYFVGKLATNKLIQSLNHDFKSNRSLDEVKKLWIKYYGELAQANQEVIDLIRTVKKHCKVYLFSNTTEMSDLHNNKTGIYDYFDGLFLSYQLGLKKPDIEFYKKIVSELKLRPEEILFIDDDPENIASAKELGIKTILFDVLKDNPSELAKEVWKNVNKNFTRRGVG